MVVTDSHARASVAYDAHHKAILAAMAKGTSCRTAAKLVGLTPQSVDAWIQEGDRDPEGRYGWFASQVRMYQGRAIAEAEAHHARFREENPNAVQWYLSKMDRATYGDDPTVVVQQAERLPDASPEEVAAAIRGAK